MATVVPMSSHAVKTQDDIVAGEFTVTPSHEKPPHLGAFILGITEVMDGNEDQRALPGPIDGVPLGLEYFVGVESLFIRPELILHEMALPLEVENRYFILDAQGNRILCVVEVNTSFNRTCFGRHRPFMLQVLDGHGRLILEIQRRCSCLLCYCGAGVYGSNVYVTLQTSNSEVMGRVLQSSSCITPTFIVINHEGQQLYKVSGPRWSSCFRYRLLARNLEFSIVDSKDGNEVGAVIKGYSLNQDWSDSNDFGLRIEKTVDPRNKALVVGAVFAVHYSYFESGNESCFGSFFCCRCTDCTGLKATLWFLVFAMLFAILMLVMLKVRAIV